MWHVHDESLMSNYFNAWMEHVATFELQFISTLGCPKKTLVLNCVSALVSEFHRYRPINDTWRTMVMEQHDACMLFVFSMYLLVQAMSNLQEELNG